MKRVAPLRYDVIFKKAFCDRDIFMAFAQDVLGIKIEIDHVETEKRFTPPIGRVDSRFDLFAQDDKNRVIVDIQHVRYLDHYDAFLHYHCAALVEQIVNAENYRPKLAVYSVIVLTSGDKHKTDMAVIDFDPKTRAGQGLGEIPHKVIYLCPKYVNDTTPQPLRQWLQAIDDTLDQTVEESHYQHPQIRRIFDLIEEDQVSPQERFQMIEEYNREQNKLEERAAALAEGKQERSVEIARSLLAKGMAVELIAEVTGLTRDEIVNL